MFEEEQILPTTDEEHLERTSPEIRPQPATELGAASASVDSVDTAHCGFRGVAPSKHLLSHAPYFQGLLFCHNFPGLHRKYSITSTSTQSACGASSSDRIASNTQFYVVPISETRTDSVRTSSQHVCKISDRLAFWLVCKASKKK